MAVEAFDYLVMNHELYRTPQGHVYGRKNGAKSPVRPLDGDRESLINAVRFDFLAAGKVLNKAAIESIVSAVTFISSTLKQREMYLRTAYLDGNVYVDQGTGDGSIIRISENGWDLLDESPVLFQRTELMQPLATPSRRGDLHLLSKYVNVDAETMPVLWGWLVASLFHNIDHPVLTLRGMAGSGKSAATSFLSELIDPSKAPKVSMPVDQKDWVAVAKSQYLLAFDNLSAMKPQASDLLCVLVTGGTFSARKLYSDSELSYFQARRVLILNGITLAGHGVDLTDRMLPIDLQTVPKGRVRDTAELHSEWTEDLPSILGGLYDLAADVIGLLSSVVPRDTTRMAKFCAILACIDAKHGTRALETYFSLLEQTALTEVDEVALLRAIQISIREPWTGTARELAKKLASQSDMPLDVAVKLPQSSNSLVSDLTRNTPTLRKLGWVVTEIPAGGHDKLKRYGFVPPEIQLECGDAEAS